MAENDNPQPQAPQQQGRKWPWRKGKQLGLNPAPSGEQAVVEPIVPAEEPIVLQDGVQPGPHPCWTAACLPSQPSCWTAGCSPDQPLWWTVPSSRPNPLCDSSSPWTHEA